MNKFFLIIFLFASCFAGSRDLELLDKYKEIVEIEADGKSKKNYITIEDVLLDPSAASAFLNDDNNQEQVDPNNDLNQKKKQSSKLRYFINSFAVAMLSSVALIGGPILARSFDNKQSSFPPAAGINDALYTTFDFYSEHCARFLVSNSDLVKNGPISQSILNEIYDKILSHRNFYSIFNNLEDFIHKKHYDFLLDQNKPFSDKLRLMAADLGLHRDEASSVSADSNVQDYYLLKRCLWAMNCPCVVSVVSANAAIVNESKKIAEEVFKCLEDYGLSGYLSSLKISEKSYFEFIEEKFESLKNNAVSCGYALADLVAIANILSRAFAKHFEYMDGISVENISNIESNYQFWVKTFYFSNYKQDYKKILKSSFVIFFKINKAIEYVPKIARFVKGLKNRSEDEDGPNCIICFMPLDQEEAVGGEDASRIFTCGQGSADGAHGKQLHLECVQNMFRTQRVQHGCPICREAAAINPLDYERESPQSAVPHSRR